LVVDRYTQVGYKECGSKNAECESKGMLNLDIVYSSAF